MQSCIKKEPNGMQWMVDGRPFLVLGGEVHNSSSSSLDYMEPLWAKLKGLALNTVLAPIYWENVEPKEGVYDFTLIDGLIKHAHEHGLRLILLWFATWKNAMSHYTPEWVKTDLVRFPRALASDGRVLQTISCFSDECRQLDGRAFAHVMAHICKVDTERTVIGMQVQNETGLLYSARDYHPDATALFDSNIPQDLADYLCENRQAIVPELALHINYSSLPGRWRDVFGSLAEEAFMAYYTARFVGSVAADGKKEYDIPMFANAWPSQCKNEPGGLHPSGGPIAQMHDIWRCAAPALDGFAADLYLENFEEECAAYTRLANNPLIIPEARPDRWVMAHAFYAFGEHGALCFSPFGIEDVGRINEVPRDAVIQSIFQTFDSHDTSALIRSTYNLLDSLSFLICRYRNTGKMRGILQNRLMNQVVELGDYYIQIFFANFVDRMQFPAGGLVIELAENDFLFAGAGYSVKFIPKPSLPPHLEYLSIEEGCFRDGTWVPGRRLNGDELQPSLPETPGLRRIRLFGFY